LLHLDIAERHRELLKLARWVDPDAGTWIQGQSRVGDLISTRPA
jgi:hypothetical protein